MSIIYLFIVLADAFAPAVLAARRGAGLLVYPARRQALPVDERPAALPVGERSCHLLCP